MTNTFVTLGSSAAIALVIALITRRIGWNTPLVLIIAGAIIGPLPFGPSAPPNPETVLVVILAPLVFGEALGSSFLDLRRVRRPVLMLAIGLVIATTFAVGYVAASMVGMPIALAFALGAVLAPTDAVAVSAAARKANLPRFLVSVLEGESLVNDGTGLTALKVALVAAAAGSVTAVEVGGYFAAAVVGGVGVGILGGWGAAWLLKKSNDLVAVNSLILVLPFLVYVVTEEVGGSGILAVVVSALIIAHQQNSDVGHTGRMQSLTLWRHVTFVLQALAFFLVGLEFSDSVGNLMEDHTVSVVWLVPAVVVVLIGVRFLFVFGMVAIGRAATNLEDRRSLIKGAVIASWAGARGPVSALAAFSIPLFITPNVPTPYRDVILATTFCVIVISVLLSMTIAPVARALGVVADNDEEMSRRIDERLARAALDRLADIESEQDAAGTPLPLSVSERLRTEMELRLTRDDPEDVSSESGQDDQRAFVMTARAMVRAEQEALLRLRREEAIPETITRPILRGLDLRDAALRAEER